MSIFVMKVIIAFLFASNAIMWYLLIDQMRFVKDFIDAVSETIIFILNKLHDSYDDRKGGKNDDFR